MFVNGVLREDFEHSDELLDADFTYLNQPAAAEYFGVKGVVGEQFRKVSTKVILAWAFDTRFDNGRNKQSDSNQPVTWHMEIG